MQKIKNENGITIITLVSTIIILLMLAGVTFYSGTSTVKESKNSKMQSELRMIQQAAISEYTKAKKLGYTNSNEIPSNFAGRIIDISDLPSTIDWQITETPIENYKAYYELIPEDLEKLGISDSEYTYILNYHTGEVYNKTEEKTSDNIILYIKASDNSHIEQEDNYSFND